MLSVSYIMEGGSKWPLTCSRAPPLYIMDGFRICRMTLMCVKVRKSEANKICSAQTSSVVSGFLVWDESSASDQPFSDSHQQFRVHRTLFQFTFY